MTRSGSLSNADTYAFVIYVFIYLFIYRSIYLSKSTAQGHPPGLLTSSNLTQVGHTIKPFTIQLHVQREDRESRYNTDDDNDNEL